MSKEKKPEPGKALLAVLTSLSVLTAGMFDAPAEEDTTLPAAPRMQMNDRILNEDDEPAEEVGEEDEDEKKKRPRSGLRQRVAAMPFMLRVLLVVPLWALGSAITALLAPALPWAASLLLSAAVTVGLVVLAAKLLFPEMPLKDIFKRKNLPVIVAGAAAVGLLGVLLPLVWDGFSVAVTLVQAAALGGALVWALRALRPAPPLPEEEPIVEEAPSPPPTKITFTDRAGDFTIDFEAMREHRDAGRR